MEVLDNWPWLFWAKRRSTACALILGQECISWQQLVADVEKQSYSFYLQGVTEHLSVALRGKNSYSLLINYLAVLQLGARVLPVNPQLPEPLLAKLLDRFNVSFGWEHDDIDNRFNWPDRVSRLDGRQSISKPDHLNFARWSAQRPATMTLTSGSSGMPKAVVHSLSAHLENADGLLQRMTFDYCDSWLLSLPLFHVSGQSIIWRWLLKGATLVIRDMRQLAGALESCTHASLVPTQLWRLLAQSESILSLKQVLLGGAMIPTDLTLEAEKRGINCWCGYGLTELAATVCAKKANGLPGVGLPLPNRDMKLENNQIYLKGAGLALGYWVNEQIVPLVDEQGWFPTRDKGVIEQGELRILGRLDNEFFSGGEGIQPEDIERVLLTHPLIEQAFIVPVLDKEFGHRPVAVIQSEQTLDLEQVLQWLDGKVARFQLPVACYTLPESLTNGGIKISRKAICDWVTIQPLKI